MAEQHPELAEEQARINKMYSSLESARDNAVKLKGMVEVGAGGTNQARWEREVIYESIANRLQDLDIGERSICFGRIDHDENSGGDSLYIGRLGISDENHNVLLVDWRAPAAEPFYRATGLQTLGLQRRRHFISRVRELVAIEDEFFGEAIEELSQNNGKKLQGQGALIAALEENKSGKLGDIVGTIQAEQDEIIRLGMKGILIVQGGPGTGKTVVGLHRAAYLLYEHRFPLADQGVLVIGPNRLFLSYIEQVLPSLGEAGVALSTLSDLVADVRVNDRDEPVAARVKGDIRMVEFLERAVKDRQRPLKEDVYLKMGARKLLLSAQATKDIVKQAQRRYRDHNAAHKFVKAEIFQLLSDVHPDGKDPQVIEDQLGHTEEFKKILLTIWPILTPAQLLHDLFGSRALIDSASGDILNDEEKNSLYRHWQSDKKASNVIWTVNDVPLLDEAWELLGPIPSRKDKDFLRTYGHIVLDEAQDLSPMQLRMLTRRSLNGSMTIVGDIGQSTGVWAHKSWDEIVEHLPEKEVTVKNLTIGYRIPQPLMDLATKVLKHAAPGIKAPVSVRNSGELPIFVETDSDNLFNSIMDVAVQAIAGSDGGNIAIISPSSLYEQIIDFADNSGIKFGKAIKDGLDSQLTVIPVHMVKGLEVNTAIVVEPSLIVSQEYQGDRALYVALTRATKNLFVVHSQSLPESMV